MSENLQLERPEVSKSSTRVTKRSKGWLTDIFTCIWLYQNQDNPKNLQGRLSIQGYLLEGLDQQCVLAHEWVCVGVCVYKNMCAHECMCEGL